MERCPDIDPVLMTVFSNYLVATAREMGVAMLETAYSSVFSEATDFSCAIFDDQADIIGQAEFCPSMLGSMHFAIKWIVDEFGLESFGSGDVYLHNDPYRGMCHLPEHMVVKSIHFKGEIIALVACIGHMTEVGGRSPGGFPGDVTDIFQEGLRIPPVKIVRDGKEVTDLWDLIAANVRTPRANRGDLRAMIGALTTGERRILELVEKYGVDEFRRITRELKDYQERRMREAIRAIPDGVYSAADYIMDNDGITDTPVRVQVTISIEDDHMTVDYSGSDAQRIGPVNSTFTATASTTFNAMIRISGLWDAPNAGCYRPITIVAPPSSVVNVSYPGSCVGGNSEMQPKIVFLILRALAPVIPKLVAAPDIGTSALISYGGWNPATSEYYSNLLIEVGGWGGRFGADGNDAVSVPHSNCRVTPVEVYESRFPMLHERYSLNDGSGGAGQFRGGLGTIREFTFEAPDVTLAAFVEREKIPPWGLFGGKPGTTCSVMVKRRGDSCYRTFREAFGTICNGKFSGVRLQAGDGLRIVTGGGGGYGPPEERQVDLMLQDIREGYCSVKDSLEAYPQLRTIV